MASAEAPASARGRWHLNRIFIGALVIVVIGAGAAVFGWNVGSWFKHIWNTITTVSVGWLLAAIVLITVQTTTAAYAWYAILRYAYGRAAVSWVHILACYATAVALNFVLPANLGTLVMMVMFTTIIAAAKFAGVLAGYVVQKIFFTFLGILVYLYLFLAVSGSFSLQFGFVSAHPVAIIVLVVGTVAVLLLVARVLRARIARWWEQAKHGGQILADPPAYFGRVVLPEAISWLAMLGMIAVFMAAYHIPVTFDTLMRVVGGNSIANMTAVTPGGAGVTQAFNVLSLKGVTSSSNATAYSVAQQLVNTAWSILLAIVLLIRAFGWSGGKTLVRESYAEAREKRAEQSSARKARREARLEARHERAAPDDSES